MDSYYGFYDIQRPTIVEDTGYETIFEKVKAKAKGEKHTWLWYKNTVKTEAFQYLKEPGRLVQEELTERQGSEVQQDKNELRNYPVVGHLYLFEYIAKGRKKLPYYDSFPLVYVVKANRGEFWGANLHYLSPKRRVWCIKRLMDGRIDIPRNCFHKYLNSAIDGYLLDLASDEWATAILLPIENFVRNVKGKAGRMSYTKEMVWEETKVGAYDRIRDKRIIHGYGSSSSREMAKGS
tara:strand:+ start:159 stop:866 length:708 start_codon:yes stop_codon:yes gene_type:complete